MHNRRGCHWQPLTSGIPLPCHRATTPPRPRPPGGAPPPPFVPHPSPTSCRGRVCLFGEHSDWAGNFRRFNSAIDPGQCIVAGTNQGLHATVTRHPRLVLRSVLQSGDEQSIMVGGCRGKCGCAWVLLPLRV
jgi:hypothetical protein